jgi:hypothetical protein
MLGSNAQKIVAGITRFSNYYGIMSPAWTFGRSTMTPRDHLGAVQQDAETHLSESRSRSPKRNPAAGEF